MHPPKRLLSLLAAVLLPGAGSAQADCSMPAAGPDVLVGAITSAASFGGTATTGAYALGTTSCNVGTVPIGWVASTPQHPLVAQNLYRYENGRFEQIGLSWVRHMVFPLQQALCCTCTPSGSSTSLGVGCSDTTSAAANGSQPLLGPRFEVDPHTGDFAYPFFAQGTSGDVLFKRLQVAHADLDPTLHPGAAYYVEAQYLAPDDAAAGNGDNNASHRRALVSTFTGGGFNLVLNGATESGLPAIAAWPVHQPGVQLRDARVPGGGLFVVGSHCTDNGGGTWHYELAVHNLNASEGAGSFTVPVPPGVTVTSIGFHDVDHHSGEPFDGTDWTGVRNPGDVTWSTDPFAVDPDANALRWGTLYNFRFDADAPPAAAPVTATLGLFEPHVPSGVAVDVCGPACPPLAASETVRLGTPPNPAALLPGQSSPPVLGAVWDPVVDHTTFFPGAALDFLAVNADGVQIDVPTPLGTLLCNVPASPFVFIAPPGTPFAVPVPDACDLVGRAVCAQAGSLGGGQIQLTNALDLVLGTQ